MPASGYEVVRYESRHRESVLDLQSLHWGPDRDMNDRQFAWKYEQNPWASKPRLYLAFHEGELVGMRGLYGSRWEAGTPTQTFDIPCAGDLVIAPAHRDRGVFTLLMRHALWDIAGEPAPFVFNLSAGTATRLGALSMGWRDLGPLAWLRWARRPKLLERSRGQAEQASPDVFGVVDRLTGDGDAQLTRRIVLSGAPRPADMAALVKRRRHDGRIRHLRDEAYFDWRFRQPTSRYRFLYLHSRSGGLDGYLVLHSKPAGVSGPVRVVDAEGDESGTGALLSAAVEQCGLNRVMSWRATIATAGERTIRRLGFSDIEVKSLTEAYPTILVLPNAQTPPPLPWRLAGHDVLSPASWDLRQAYSDGV